MIGGRGGYYSLHSLIFVQNHIRNHQATNLLIDGFGNDFVLLLRFWKRLRSSFEVFYDREEQNGQTGPRKALSTLFLP